VLYIFHLNRKSGSRKFHGAFYILHPRAVKSVSHNNLLPSQGFISRHSMAFFSSSSVKEADHLDDAGLPALLLAVGEVDEGCDADDEDYYGDAAKSNGEDVHFCLE